VRSNREETPDFVLCGPEVEMGLVIPEEVIDFPVIWYRDLLMRGSLLIIYRMNPRVSDGKRVEREELKDTRLSDLSGKDIMAACFGREPDYSCKLEHLVSETPVISELTERQNGVATPSGHRGSRLDRGSSPVQAEPERDDYRNEEKEEREPRVHRKGTQEGRGEGRAPFLVGRRSRKGVPAHATEGRAFGLLSQKRASLGGSRRTDSPIPSHPPLPRTARK
jgi:hypothetical protein